VQATIEDELLGPPLQRYFCDYLINQRQLSPRTVAAYRDTFKLLLEFFERRRGSKPDSLRLKDVDADSVLAFLDDLERTRRNCARSRNARLAAIRSFVRFAVASNPPLLPVAQRVLAIPSKRFERGIVKHLAWSEDSWFHGKMLGAAVPEPWASAPMVDDPDWPFRSAREDSVKELLDLYADACERSRAAAMRFDSLDALAARPSFGRGPVNLRWLLVHMVDETARHAGHIDLLLDARP